MDSESIFKVEPPGYADGLNMTVGEKGIEDTFKGLVLRNKNEVGSPRNRNLGRGEFV